MGTEFSQAASSAALQGVSAASALGECSGAVKVILDPIHDGVYYPYFEVSVNNRVDPPQRQQRRAAPQFRSQGIGYLKLCDDMNKHGTSFVAARTGGADGALRAQRRRVSVRDLPFDPSRVEVTAGLASGDRVAVSGVAALHDGAPVRSRDMAAPARTGGEPKAGAS